MNFVRVYAIVLRQFYLMRGSFSRVFPIFAWVAIDIILWGFLTKYLNTISSPGLNFIPLFLGAILIWDFFIRVMQGVTMAFFEDVWSRNFLNFFATPLSISEYLSGLVLISILTSAIGLIVMIILSSFIFGLSFAVYGIHLLPFLMILFMFGITLGILASAMVLRLGPAAEWFVWPIPAFISPFVGVLYPISILPQWMQIISRILPPAYVFESMRDIVVGKSVSFGVLWLAGGLGVVYIFVSIWFFKRTYRHSVRTGVIARYSAETIS